MVLLIFWAVLLQRVSEDSGDSPGGHSEVLVDEAPDYAEVEC